MKELLLCKYGEVALKGLNRSYFEKMMIKCLSDRLKNIGNFKIWSAQSTIYVLPESEDEDIDAALDVARKVFGIISVSRAVEAPKDIDKIKEIAKEYLPLYMGRYKSFKCEARRCDKTFALTSPQISAEVGEAVLDAIPGIKVDLHNPDVIVMTEIRDDMAYIHAGSYKGAGGVPGGSSGRGLLLLSGGIDSPVAGYMMAKRGLTLDAIYYESIPYTSEQARDKVLELARIVSEFSGKINVHVISLTMLQEAIRDNCDEDYFTLLLRRSMMRLADRCADYFRCESLITGESLGQVASQTMQALSVTDIIASRPVFRPCIGLDKEEIVVTARNIGTFETSILPYEDCCTVFTPKHPKTKPVLSKVEEQEKKFDFAKFEDEAFAGIRTWVVDAYRSEPISTPV